MRPKKQLPEVDVADVNTFAADLWSFAEENWQRFLEWAEEHDYTEARCEELAAAIKA